jgi:hypothetical protein
MREEMQMLYQETPFCQVPVAHACYPSYSGGRDQEDRGWKPAQANSSLRPYLGKTFHKNRAGGVAQGEGSEFKPQYQKKKKKKKCPSYCREGNTRN